MELELRHPIPLARMMIGKAKQFADARRVGCQFEDLDEELKSLEPSTPRRVARMRRAPSLTTVEGADGDGAYG